MSHYRVRIKQGENEIEIESSEKSYVDTKLKEIGSSFSLHKTPLRNSSGNSTKKTGAKTKPLSMVEHVRALAPKGGTQYAIAVGHYFETFGGKAEEGFKNQDISDAYKKVKFKHSNPAKTVTDAKKQGYFMDGPTDGTLQLTQTALEWVENQQNEK